MELQLFSKNAVAPVDDTPDFGAIKEFRIFYSASLPQVAFFEGAPIKHAIIAKACIGKLAKLTKSAITSKLAVFPLKSNIRQVLRSK